MQNLNIRNIVIARGSRNALRKVKDLVWGNALQAIENGDWWIPVGSHDYDDIKEYLESTAFHEFYGLPDDLVVSVEDFKTDIVLYK